MVPTGTGLFGVVVLMRLAHDANPAVFNYYTMLKFHWSPWQVGLSLMAVGALINNGVYVLAFQLFPALREWPAVAVAAGSVAGSVANFVFARTLLFGAAKTPA